MIEHKFRVEKNTLKDLEKIKSLVYNLYLFIYLNYENLLNSTLLLVLAFKNCPSFIFIIYSIIIKRCPDVYLYLFPTFAANLHPDHPRWTEICSMHRERFSIPAKKRKGNWRVSRSSPFFAISSGRSKSFCPYFYEAAARAIAAYC